MISSDGCRQLVAGNYDVIINDSSASFRSVLTNFLDHFRRHEEALGQADCLYTSEFKLLKEFSKTLKEDKTNLLDGELAFNRVKNRYKDIIPFNHTRVILGNQPETDPGSSYINANYVRGPSGSPHAYIACQGPLPCTLDDFWRMIWECNVSVVIMACNENESDRPKCEIYWPEHIDTSQTYGNIRVTLTRVRQINSDFLIRKFSIKLLEPIATNGHHHHHHHHHHHQQQQHQQPQQQVINNEQQGNTIYGNKEYITTATAITTATKNATTATTDNLNENTYAQTNDYIIHKAHLNRNSLSNNVNGSTGNSSTSNESIYTDEFLQNHQQPQTTQHFETIDPNHQHNHHNHHHHHQQQQEQQSRVLAERTICQFHYTTWPDHGVPNSVQPILELVRLVREVQPAEDKPILVHCSAGCGRTGTICCIDYVWGLMRRGSLDSSFNLCSIIGDMRKQRMAMVQTLEQYILCHRTVASLFVQQLQLIDEQSDDNFETDEKNFDQDDQELGPVFI